MELSGWWIVAIGFLAQGFFSARIIVQWILSEKSGKVESPILYWVFSIIGSWLFLVYGWFRHDFAIIFGQFITFYIYLWNLHKKDAWKGINPALKAVLLGTPLLAAGFIAYNFDSFVESFLRAENIPMWLVVYGSLGQLVFAFRFVYQLVYSAYRGESLLPAGFWVLSLVACGMIISYGIIRADIVLVIGQSVGFIAYSRNLVIGARQHKQQQ
ncbi:MAG: lipid-A-disaccharide synthase N-terminal domain-containing protein [Tidjanibacter sp.]|nr:lipid-A-disaccharide synthase N-terminal domain-containing protein [Tidjanibacter sp.]